jgi:hypothetical protein
MHFVLQSFNVLELVHTEFRFSIPLSSESSLHLLQDVMIQSLQARFIFCNKESECKCNVTLSRVRVTTVTMEKQ